MDARISPKDEVRVRLSTEVLKYKIMEELRLIRDNYWATKDGRIYSTKRNMYLKQRVGPRGYMMVNLSIDGRCKTFTVDGIGISDKAMAFRIDKELMGIPCANNIPHITICTFNGGKPADSNDITEWKDIEPILVETKLRKV